MSLSKSYSHTVQSQSFLHTTIPERLEFLARQNPEKNAFILYSKENEKTTVRRKDLYDRSIKFAKGLIKYGIKSGDVVGVSLSNNTEWLVSTFGIMAAGAIPLFFVFDNVDGEDVVQVLNNLEERCSALVFMPGNQDINWKILEKIAKIEKEKGKVSSAKVPSLHLVICDKLPTISDHPLTVNGILSEENATEVVLPKCDPDDVCAIFLTSGSTGASKAVPRTHVSMFLMGYHNSIAHDMNESDIYYYESLFRWGGGFPHTFLYTGITRVTVESFLNFKSVAERTALSVKCIETEACTVASIFPYCLMDMAKEIYPCKQWPLKAVSSTGFPIPKICAEIGCKIAKKFINAYGSTELGYIAAKYVYEPSEYTSFMIGQPCSGIEMKIADENGYAVPINKHGEILVRHCSQFLGYMNSKEKTEAVLTSTGWYRTDDAGFMNKNGDIVLLGRNSDVMIIAEAVIHPSYMEEKIKNHPDVEEVCVVPIEDEKFYQQQCACVVPRAGKQLDKKAIVAHLAQGFVNLTENEYGITVPKYFLFLNSLPKTPVGKIFRKGIADLAKEKLKQKT